jgi:hypothetical protein
MRITNATASGFLKKTGWGQLAPARLLTYRKSAGVMTNILDHVSSTPVLEVDVWPRSASRKEWFAITRRIIQDTIADMNLDPAAEAEVIEAFKGAGLL